MGEFWIDSLTDSGHHPITLTPEYDYLEREVAIRATHRTVGGVQRIYDWTQYKAFTVPLRFVSSADAFRINQWWRDQDMLGFTLDTSEDLRTVDCRLVNETVPLGSFIKPYRDLYGGVLMLEATDASSFKEKFFVLDDPPNSGSLAHLDQTYNSIR